MSKTAKFSSSSTLSTPSPLLFRSWRKMFVPDTEESAREWSPLTEEDSTKTIYWKLVSLVSSFLLLFVPFLNRICWLPAWGEEVWSQVLPFNKRFVNKWSKASSHFFSLYNKYSISVQRILSKFYVKSWKLWNDRTSQILLTVKSSSTQVVTGWRDTRYTTIRKTHRATDMITR